MSKTKEAVSDAETLTRVKRSVLSREESVNQIDGLFDRAKDARKKDVAQMDKLLVQAPGAQVQSVNLQRDEVAKNVNAFFEKKAYLTEAQKRFPELLKVANTESQAQVISGKKPAGKIPARPLISGGQQ